MKSRCALLIASVLAIPTGAIEASGSDWSHILGRNHDLKTVQQVPDDLRSQRPRKLWEISCNGGFSSFVTGDGRAYTVLARSAGGTKRETVVALDRETGKSVWEKPLGVSSYDGGAERGAPGNDGGEGPRATPTYADKRVFVFGGKFDLHALDSASGRILWTRQLLEEFGASEIQWSNTAAPLVVGDRVLVAGGGDGQCYLAFRVEDGKLLWKSGTDKVSHSTPVLTTIHGKQQALFMVRRGLVSIDPADGAELWHYPFAFRTSVGASPAVWNDIVHCTAGYGIGGGACKITRDGDKWEVEELWRSRGNQDTASHWSTPVVHEGFLYGSYGFAEFGSASFKCIDIRTGKVQWAQPGFGHGEVVMAGSRLVALTDAGKISVIDPSPAGYREITQAALIGGKCWSRPALSDGQLLLRSTTQGICFEL